jgi:uncharacterized integral membrane protein
MSPLEPLTATSIRRDAIGISVCPIRVISGSILATRSIEVTVSDTDKGSAPRGRTVVRLHGFEGSDARSISVCWRRSSSRIALLIFILQKHDEEEVTWLFFDASAPLWVVIVVTGGAVGRVLSQLVLWVVRRRRRRGRLTEARCTR